MSAELIHLPRAHRSERCVASKPHASRPIGGGNAAMAAALSNHAYQQARVMRGTLRSRLFNPPNAVPDHGIDLGGKAIAAARQRIIEQEQQILRLSMHAPKIAAPEPPPKEEPPKPDIGPEPKHHVKRIQYVCAKRHGITIDLMVQPSNRHVFTRPRQIAMYLSSLLTSASSSALGRIFRRDHSTILYGISKIARLIETDAELAAEIEDIKRELSQ